MSNYCWTALARVMFNRLLSKDFPDDLQKLPAILVYIINL